MKVMDRYWFLTWTTYGTWLPGDDRGFVSNFDAGEGRGERVNQIGRVPAAAMRGLQNYAAEKLDGPPVFLSQTQADTLVPQFLETTSHRGWQLVSVAVMRSHLHLVVGVSGDPEPEDILRDFKSYASRCLNELVGKAPTRRPKIWWTESGSKRKLPDADAVMRAINYVQSQEQPLVIWIHPEQVNSSVTPSGGERGT